MNNNLSATLKKLSLPILITLFGVTLIIFAQTSDQPPKFGISAILITVSGLVMLYFSLGSNIAKIATALAVVLGIAGSYVYYTVTSDVINIDLARQLDKEMDELIKQNLTDIKTAQVSYKEIHGSYAKDFDVLKNFISEGKIKIAVKNGGVPNRRLTPEERSIIYGAGDQRALDYNMTEDEAIILSKSSNPPAELKGFVRDTILSSFFESSFGAPAYKQRRVKMGFPEFKVDSIFYIPASGKRFKMTITDSVEYQGVKVQALLVEGTRKMKSLNTKTTYSFGSASSPALSTSWD
jgi:hypothetical protein